MKKLQEAQFWARAGDHKFSLTKLYLEMPIRYLGLPRWLSGKEYMPMQQRSPLLSMTFWISHLLCVVFSFAAERVEIPLSPFSIAHPAIFIPSSLLSK